MDNDTRRAVEAADHIARYVEQADVVENLDRDEPRGATEAAGEGGRVVDPRDRVALDQSCRRVTHSHHVDSAKYVVQPADHRRAGPAGASEPDHIARDGVERSRPAADPNA